MTETKPISLLVCIFIRFTKWRNLCIASRLAHPHFSNEHPDDKKLGDEFDRRLCAPGGRNRMKRALKMLVAVLCAGAALPCSAQTKAAGKFEVTETTIPKVLEAILTGKVTCRQLVEAYLRRIRAY